MMIRFGEVDFEAVLSIKKRKRENRDVLEIVTSGSLIVLTPVEGRFEQFWELFLCLPVDTCDYDTLESWWCGDGVLEDIELIRMGVNVDSSEQQRKTA